MRPVRPGGVPRWHGRSTFRPFAGTPTRFSTMSASLGSVRQSAFQGSRVAMPSRRCGAKKAATSRVVVVRAEKVVGIDLGTTNSAVRMPVCMPRGRCHPLLGPPGGGAHAWKTVSLVAAAVEPLILTLPPPHCPPRWLSWRAASQPL